MLSFLSILLFPLYLLCLPFLYLHDFWVGRKIAPNTEPRPYYKVVLRKKGWLNPTSCGTCGVYRVQYTPRHWQKAPIGGLFVFTSLDWARDFRDTLTLGGKESAEIWLCYGLNPISIAGQVSYRPSSREIEAYWHPTDTRYLDPRYQATCYAYVEGTRTSLHPVPQGTQCFKQIRLVSQVTEPKEPEYYKVVRKTQEGLLVSSAQGVLARDWVTTYTPGAWAEAPIGGLFVFGTYSRAYLEAQRIGYEVWSCAVEEPVKLHRDILGGTMAAVPSSPAAIARFWLWEGDGTASDRMVLPASTYCFKRVRLQERLFEYQAPEAQG